MLHESPIISSTPPRRIIRSAGSRKVTRASRQRESWENANSVFRTGSPAQTVVSKQHGNVRHQPMRPSGQPDQHVAAYSSRNHQAASLRAGEETWLEDALAELAECPDQAVDEGLDKPTELGLTKARRLLERVSLHVGERPEVYPMDEGSIAIDFRSSQNMSGVLFLVESNGSGALFSRTPKSRGRLRVDDAEDLLGEGGMLEIRRVGIR